MEAYNELRQHAIVAHAVEFAGVDVTMAQAKVLYVVTATGGIHISELAARLRVTTSTVSGLVDRLVDAGLLSRRGDLEDRRGVVVSPTPAALDVLERFRELNDRQFRDILGRVSDADLRIVDDAVRIIVAAARAANQTSASTPGSNS